MSGCVVWLTGLPSSGKSTLARSAQARLQAAGVACALLDGDEVRGCLVPPPGYSPPEREAFYATLAALAALLAHQGLVVLVAATAHRRAWREQARALAPRFLEVYVATPPGECARRDAKGLYARARRGLAAQVPGAGVAYEPPEQPAVVASGGHDEPALQSLVAHARASAPTP